MGGWHLSKEQNGGFKACFKEINETSWLNYNEKQERETLSYLPRHNNNKNCQQVYKHSTNYQEYPQEGLYPSNRRFQRLTWGK